MNIYQCQIAEIATLIDPYKVDNLVLDEAYKAAVLFPRQGHVIPLGEGALCFEWEHGPYTLQAHCNAYDCKGHADAVGWEVWTPGAITIVGSVEEADAFVRSAMSRLGWPSPF